MHSITATAGSVSSRPFSAPAEARPTSKHLTQDDLDYGIAFAKRQADKYCRQHPRADQGTVSSWAVSGAYDAWLNFTPDRSAKWTTYLTNMVAWYIQKGIRPTKERTYNRFMDQHQVVSLDDRPTLHSEDTSSLHDLCADPEAQHSIRTEWVQVLAELPDSERWIIAQRYYHERSCSDIARQVGGEWTAMKVWRLEQQALKRLRIMLAA